MREAVIVEYGTLLKSSQSAAAISAVVPRESGGSSIRQRLCSARKAGVYWIARSRAQLRAGRAMTVVDVADAYTRIGIST